MSLTLSISPASSSHSRFSSSTSNPRMNFLSKFSKKRSSSHHAKDAVDAAAATSFLSSRSLADPSIPSRTTPTRRPQSHMEPPPSYNDSVKNSSRGTSPVPSPTTATMGVPAPVAATTTAVDSPYAFLAQFDTIFLVDDSGSMCGRGWRETAAALSAITPICTAHDADGLDIFFLNHRNRRTNSGLAPGGYTNVNTTAAVQEIFASVRPTGGTPTGTRLNQILKPYLATLEASLKSSPNASPVKPINIIVITDGVPSDDVESVIVAAARKLDKLEAEPWQIGIQFFQVGEEPEAADDLRELDDVLSTQHRVRDIVDTVPWSGQTGTTLSAELMLKITMGSINRRLDRRQAALPGTTA